MNVALVDIDSHHFPNLVLMKLSAWHKQRGDKTFLVRPAEFLNGDLFTTYDKIYGACVFAENAQLAYKVEKAGGYVAGSGTGKLDTLPDEIEHIMPDYSLYGITDTAYGFLTRGCPRCCPFCIVSNKEGQESRKVADLSEWWNGQKYIKLLDPNILACAEHLDLLRQLADAGAYIDITQGLDARLLTDANIEMINALKIKMLHFAWDNPLNKSVPEALENFSRRSQIKDPRKLTVYVLTNYNSTHKQDLERIYWLRDNGFSPYVMIYDKTNAPKQTRQLQRWINNRWVFRSTNTFAEYKKQM